MGKIQDGTIKPGPWPRVLLVLCGLCLSILLVECALRFGGFVLTSSRAFENRLKMERRGSCTVLCLGESTTAWQYPGMLEEALNQKSARLRFKVIDQGVPETKTSSILANLDSYLDRYHPDIIVAMMGINDLGQYIPYDRQIFFKHFKSYKLLSLIAANVLSRLKNDAPVSPPPKFDAPPYSYQELKDSTESLEIKLRDDPGDQFTYAMLCKAYCLNGRVDKMRGLIDNAHKIFGAAEVVNDELGGYYKVIYGPKDERPVKYLESLARKKVNRPRVYIYLGDLYLKRGYPQKAIEAYKQGLEVDKNNHQLLDSIAMVYNEMGEESLAREYSGRTALFHESSYNVETRTNYLKLERAASANGIKLVCMQYPMRDIAPLKEMLGDNGGAVLFVSNKENFKKALKERGFWYYFKDSFAGDFGHCTDEGNRLIADNLSDGILNKWFKGQKK
jgi:tetratricopeptide (TPR) repeat protein